MIKSGGMAVRILVVEDEKLLADTVAAFLKSKGFGVDTVYDGEAGEAYARWASMTC